MMNYIPASIMKQFTHLYIKPLTIRQLGIFSDEMKEIWKNSYMYVLDFLDTNTIYYTTVYAIHRSRIKTNIHNVIMIIIKLKWSEHIILKITSQ